MFNFDWFIGISVWFMGIALAWKILLVATILIILANLAIIPLDHRDRKKRKAEEEFKKAEELCGKMC